MSKGKITIIVLVIFMVLAASIGGIYAYYSINQKEKTDLASIIASMEKEINKNVETITHLEQTLELNGLELEDLIKKEVEYKTIVDDRTKTRKQYIERTQYITQTLTDKQTIYKTKTETKTKIEKEIEILTEELENTNSSDVEKITEIQEKIIEKEKEKIVVQKEIEEIEKVIIEYEKELVEVEERINVLTININQVNEMITELNVSINLIGKTEEETRELVKSLEDENAVLSEELAYAKAEIENLKANAEAKYQNIIDNLNSDISNLSNRLSATEKNLNSYIETNNSLRQTIINLENEIDELNELNEKLKDELDETTSDSEIRYEYFFVDSAGIKKTFQFQDEYLSVYSAGGYGERYHFYLDGSYKSFKYQDITRIVVLNDLSTNDYIAIVQTCYLDEYYYDCRAVRDGEHLSYRPEEILEYCSEIFEANSSWVYSTVFFDRYLLVSLVSRY